MKTHNTEYLPVLKFEASFLNDIKFLYVYTEVEPLNLYVNKKRHRILSSCSMCRTRFFFEHKEISQEIENQTDPERKMIFF